MMKRFTIPQRIKKGASFLTKHIGVNWTERINTDTLDLDSCNQCILGQTDEVSYGYSGDYHHHQMALGLNDNKSANLGFIGYKALDRSTPGGPIKARAEHELLTKAWLKYLEGADNA